MEVLHRDMKACNACGLHTGCRQVVPGEGSAEALIVFLAEGPGETEDKRGLPLVGWAGKLFRSELRKSGLDQVPHYISNMVRCRPPDNRDPLPEEIKACWPWTLKTLQYIRPKVVVPMGKPALFTLAHVFDFGKKLGGQAKITKLAGVPIYLEDRDFYVYPLVHPSFARRNKSAAVEFSHHIMYLRQALPGWLRGSKGESKNEAKKSK